MSSESMAILAPNDVAARLDDLRGLKDGWLDDGGLAPRPKGLDWLVSCFGAYYPDGLPLPYLYPTAEGGVQAEWSLGTHEVTLEIDLHRRFGRWHSVDTRTQADNWKRMGLARPAAWAAIASEIRRMLAVGGR